MAIERGILHDAQNQPTPEEENEEENEELLHHHDAENIAASNQFSWKPKERKLASSPAPPPPPLWTWFLLAGSLMAVSSAGVVFALMRDVPPITLAAWRQQLTALILTIAAIVQWRRLDDEDDDGTTNIKTDTLRNRHLLAASGTSLAIHFATWVASTQLTSLTHSLLYVSATPVLLACFTWLRGHPGLISRGELFGTAVGFLGTIVLASSAVSEDEVTLVGDFSALVASAAVLPYLLIGRHLRAWMPLFLYAAPVTAVAAMELTLGALFVEASTIFRGGANGVFGWVADFHYFPKVMYLGIVPGLLGHTGINALLKYLNPLIITLVLNVEPLVGSVLGYVVGVAAAPGWFTYVGGALILGSTAIVSFASNEREKLAAAAAAVEKGTRQNVEVVYVGRVDDGCDDAG